MSQYSAEYTDSHDDLLDQELLLKIQQSDDRQAFEMLYIRYFHKLAAFACLIVNDRDMAEDIVQSVFIYIWEKRKEINISSSLKGYLSTAVRNKSTKTITQQKRLVSTDTLFNTPTSIPTPEQQLEKDSLHQLIIKILPDNIKTIYYLRHVNGMKQKEIAQELNMSENTLEKKLAKIKFYLRKLAAQLLALLLLLG